MYTTAILYFNSAIIWGINIKGGCEPILEIPIWNTSALKMQSTLNSSNNFWKDRRRSQLKEKVTIAMKVNCVQRHEEDKGVFNHSTGMRSEGR